MHVLAVSLSISPDCGACVGLVSGVQGLGLGSRFSEQGQHPHLRKGMGTGFGWRAALPCALKPPPLCAGELQSGAEPGKGVKLLWQLICSTVIQRTGLHSQQEPWGLVGSSSYAAAASQRHGGCRCASIAQPCHHAIATLFAPGLLLAYSRARVVPACWTSPSVHVVPLLRVALSVGFSAIRTHCDFCSTRCAAGLGCGCAACSFTWYLSERPAIGSTSCHCPVPCGCEIGGAARIVSS